MKRTRRKRHSDPFKEPEFSQRLAENEKRFTKRRESLREADRHSPESMAIRLKPEK